MENLTIYNAVREVPQTALKKITGGRLNGKSDINPMWRLKMLTEQFGPCGIGWKYTIDKQWIEKGEGVEQAAFVNISLQVKVDGEWSAPIPGTGGSAFVTQEKSGAYTSDECYKMALTDAISVACKALGFGADVYWNSDETKGSSAAARRGVEEKFITAEQLSGLRDLILTIPGYSEAQFCSEARISQIENLPIERFKGAFNHLQQKAVKVAA